MKNFPRKISFHQWHSALKQIRRSSLKMESSRAKNAPYIFLKTLYEIHCAWRDTRSSHRLTKAIAETLQQKMRNDIHPLRILIEAGCSRDSKTKSRWSRALQHAADENIAPAKLISYFEDNKGIAGVAGMAASENPLKRRKSRDDWAE